MTYKSPTNSMFKLSLTKYVGVIELIVFYYIVFGL